MTFTVASLEYYIAIVVRIAGFVYTAPFFGIKDVPQRAKVLLSLALGVIVYYMVPAEGILYDGVIEYAAIIVKEAIAGMVLGLFCNLAYYILQFSGQIADMEIGTSMATQLDPTSNLQVTITSNILTYAVMLTMVATNLHLYIVRAVIDSFEIIPVGKVNMSENIFQMYLGYMLDYFILAFRIILPVFAAILVVNTVLAILAKAAPQLNMFVIGHQLKIFVGIFCLCLMMIYLPSISDFILNKMIVMMKTAIAYLSS